MGEARRPSTREWQKAGSKRRSRNHTNSFYKEKQITKFFENVYIARKRNAAGLVFGFVSFVDVYDGLELQRKLGKISIGKNKLRVNIAKYAVENFDQRFAQNKKAGTDINGSRPDFQSNSDKFYKNPTEGGVSYLSKLMNQSEEVPKGVSKKAETVIQINENVSAFQDLHGKAIVGKVLDFAILRSIKDILKNEGWDGLEIVYVSGLHVMVCFEQDDKAYSFCKWVGWKTWFSEVDVWKGQTFPF